MKLPLALLTYALHIVAFPKTVHGRINGTSSFTMMQDSIEEQGKVVDTIFQTKHPTCKTITLLQQTQYWYYNVGTSSTVRVVGDWPLDDFNYDAIAYDYAHKIGNNGNYFGITTEDVVVSGSRNDPICAYRSFDSRFNDKMVVPSTGPNYFRLEPRSVSVELWFRGISPIGTGKYLLSNEDNDRNWASYALHTPSEGLTFYIGDNAGFDVSNNLGTGVWNNQWHHVVGTFDDDSGDISIYLDGVQNGDPVNTDRSIGYDLTKSRNLMIGNCEGCTNDRYFTGDIAGVRIWNGALSPITVRELYYDTRARRV